jgi:two-component system, OmpR family, sensor kinase
MKLKLFLKKYYPALIVLIVLLAFSFAAYQGARTASIGRRSKIFETRVQRLTADLKNRMTDYIQILKGCQGLFYASDSVTSNDWKIYTNNLKVSENYPGIQAIAYAPYILRKQNSILEQRIHQFKPNFRIKSTFKNEYFTPVLYIEPFTNRNLRAWGYDLYSNPVRREAIDRAISTGEAAITKKITLVQETSKNIQPGFLMFMPIYKIGQNFHSTESRKQNASGVVANVFRAHDLMNVLFKPYTDLNIQVYDGTETKPDNLLYNSSSLVKASFFLNSGSFDLKSNTHILIAGNFWTIVVTPKQQFGSELERQQPALILVFGLSISVLLFMLTFNGIKRQSEIAEELLISKSLDSKKDEFIGIASHELKTPLTSIKAYMQLLERSNLEEREKNFIRKANSNINKLSNLIGDLLDVSKVQAGRLQLNIAQFLLPKLITESIENVQHMYGSHQIINRNSIPILTLYGDVPRLEQCMINLLVNAMKYSPGAKFIYVNTVVSTQEVRIEIIDHGLGISKENQAKIFDRYFRAEELSPVISGLGMGLYISNEIVKQHGGKMEVKSTLGKGSTFSITLPLQRD